MASFNCSGLEEVNLSMQQIADLPDDVQDDMLRAGADALIPIQQSKAWELGVHDTGIMANSIKKTRVKMQKHGGRAITVYPQGSRHRHNTTTRNSEIAFVNEFGTKHQKPRAFVAESIKAASAAVVRAEAAVYDRWLDKK